MIRSTHRFRLLAGASLVLTVSGVAAVTPSVAGQSFCEATLMPSGLTYGTLAEAVAEAPGGATIQVRGSCLGPIVVTKSLTIVGKPSDELGAPGIYGQESVRVLETWAGRTVTVKNLEIAYGYVESTGVGSVETAGLGGGILNRGTLTLTNVVVTENDAVNGAGIANLGTLLVDGASQVHHNRASENGAGIASWGATTLAGTTAVYQNTAAGFGGGIAALGGATDGRQLMLRDAAVVRDNQAPNGGGIASEGTPILLRDTASVRLNVATADGGGIHLVGARLTMEGRASVSGNEGDFVGGIVGEPSGAKAPKVTLKGSSVVRRNVADQIGGIYLSAGSLTMLDESSVRGHREPSIAAVAIGAPHGLPATFTMKGRSRVTDNRLGTGWWAAVLRFRCPDAVKPTLVGVRSRVTGNTPANVKTVCP